MKQYNLFEIPEEILSSVGGKAENLCKMHQAGMNVPRGFIITEIEKESSFEEAAEWYEKLALTRVAVRSSAAGEDGEDFSAAGQYETILGVEGKEALKDAVKACIASSERTEAKQYNEVFTGTKQAQMTVVIQEMIDADVAGVCFLKDPSGNDGTLIEAVKGLGEALVSGKEQAEQYGVKEDGSLSKKGSLLTEAQAKEIANGAREISQKLGFEADTEWALKDGRIYWLQARPVTTSDLPDIGEFDVDWPLDGRVCYTNNISEMMPGAITPLTRSTSLYALDWGVRKLMIHVHVYKDYEEAHDYCCYFTIANHAVGDMTSIYRTTQAMAFSSKPSIDLSLCGRELTDSPAPPPFHVNPVSRLFNFIRYITAISSNKHTHKMIVKITDSIVFDTDASAKALWSEIDKKLSLFNEATYYHYLSTAYSASMGAAFNLALKPYFDSDEDRDAAVAGCLQNIDGIESVDILRSMRKIAREAIAHIPNAAALSAEELKNAVLADTGAVKEAYDAFMKKHGHRAISESEMRSPGLEDDWEGFFQQLGKVILSGGEEPKAEGDSWEKHRDDLFAIVSKKDKKTLGFLLKAARNGVCYREFTKSYYAKAANIFKRAYRVLAQKLVQDKILPDEDLIYFLTHQEIGALLEGKRALIKRAMARRRLYPAQQAVKLPDISYGRPIPKKQVEEDTATLASYNGTPVSRGACKGKARVVRSLQDANQLEMGEIMVASITDVGWTPYYCLLGALVTEKGAALSHGAVVAREYSLPLVTNVENITNKINTGDYISVNGSAGTITVLSRTTTC